MTSASRQLAYRVLRRIESEGAYANIALAAALERSKLSDADRRFVTDLVYGTTRMRRACDALVDRFVSAPPDPGTRTVLRLGAYQLAFAGVPAHAAVGETVALASRHTRGFVNAVLRKVATTPMVWPSEWAQLSYPDWIADTLVAELGADDGRAAMERMNAPATVTTRPDGYIQDLSSQWVAAAVEARPGELILDACAAPGGKATALAACGADVIAGDARWHRAGLVLSNAARLGVDVATIVADATTPPFGDGVFDAVLIDAPCSGLGALRRRPDARWRIEPGDVQDLAELQRRMLARGAPLVRLGGRIVYSVCTLTATESVDRLTPAGFEVDDRRPASGEWRRYRQGWRVLPQDADTDGMVLVRYRRTA